MRRHVGADVGWNALLGSRLLSIKVCLHGSPCDPSGPPDPAAQIPTCPRCAKTMVLRTAKTGKNSGRQFWGCSAYLECNGAVDL